MVFAETFDFGKDQIRFHDQHMQENTRSVITFSYFLSYFVDFSSLLPSVQYHLFHLNIKSMFLSSSPRPCLRRCV